MAFTHHRCVTDRGGSDDPRRCYRPWPGSALRWDIINLVLPPPNPLLPTFTAGGVAYASARNGGAPSGLKIKLTGSGTFVAPASGGESSAVTGGGTWETFKGCPAACVSIG